MTHTAQGPFTGRIESIDTLRGFAVLGILMVNCAYLGLPMSEAAALPAAGERSLLDLLAWGFVGGFFELKFVTLFSFLFGVGFALQMERGASSASYWRRLGILAVFGLLHGTLLFMGDVLFLYAICGSVLLLVRKLSPRVMLGLGFAMLALMVPWVSVLGMLELAQKMEPSAAVELAEGVVSPGEAFGAAFLEEPARQAAIELRVFGEGPLASSVALRSGEFLLFLIVCAVYFGWRVMGIFLIGAACYRLGLFSEAGRVWRVRLRNFGLGVGLPLALLGTALSAHGGDESLMLIAGLGTGVSEVGALVLAAGYAGAVLLWAESARGALAHSLAAVGHTALSNYIGQSLLMCLLMCHWGLGLYGELDLPQLLALSALIFALQLVASPLWLARFRMGPLEWLWRWATHAARPAFRR